MTKQLFASLRVIFGSHSKGFQGDQIKRWAQMEYKDDWRFAYDQIINENMTTHGKKLK